MFVPRLLTGRAMADRTLCLTFDDGPGKTTTPGPGPRTIALAEYLQSQHIPATFFVVGKLVADFPGAIAQVSAMGHLIANHTYDHVDLCNPVSNNGQIAQQISKTNQ